jgi:hypothetical protein
MNSYKDGSFLSTIKRDRSAAHVLSSTYSMKSLFTNYVKAWSPKCPQQSFLFYVLQCDISFLKCIKVFIKAYTEVLNYELSY